MVLIVTLHFVINTAAAVLFVGKLRKFFRNQASNNVVCLQSTCDLRKVKGAKSAILCEKKEFCNEDALSQPQPDSASARPFLLCLFYILCMFFLCSKFN